MQELLKNNPTFSEFFRQNFQTIKKETETFLRTNLFNTKLLPKITFDKIYRRIQINHSLDVSQTRFLKELEIKCEIENINKLKKIICSGNTVILITDMYHSEDTIRRILTGIDNVFKEVKIYVSAEYKKKTMEVCTNI